jgi:hypothetical protein
MKRFIVKDSNGLPMRVIRPSDSTICLRIAEECKATNDTKRFDNLPTEAEAAGVSYTLVGFLARKFNGMGACVADRKGNYLEPLRPGDSFITLEQDAP